VQVNSVLLKGDAISNIIRANSTIMTEVGIKNDIVLDFFSEYDNEGIELVDLDFKELASIWAKLKYFVRINKGYVFREYVKALLSYRRNRGNGLLDKAKRRIWQFGLAYPLFKLIRPNDIVYFHNFGYPYLSDYVGVGIDASRGLQDMKFIPMKFITHSKFNRDTLTRLGFEEENIRLLPAFHRVKDGYKQHDTKEPHLLTWGRYSNNKAVPQLAKLCSEAGLKLTAFGDNYTTMEYSNNYKKCKRYENPDHIRFFGKLPTIDRFFDEANIVITNSFHEGWCTPLSEGMARSMPILVRRGTGSEEQVVEGKNGYLFDNVDEIPQLAQKIMNSYSTMAYHAWQEAQRYTYDKYKEGYLRILKEFE
jgi:glycosyltransferase involved in cell wall biosynthesis